MEVKLVKKQLDHISNLIQQKGVNYYDVNMEMTDHIASEVEDLMTETNAVFYEAVKKVFSGYGRFHFMKIEDEKIEKIQKQSWKQAKKSFVCFFTIPKIVITISLFLFFQFAMENSWIDYVYYSYIAIVVITSGYLFYLKRKWIGKNNFLQLHKFHGAFFVLFGSTGFGMGLLHL